MSIDESLESLGIRLPDPPPPAGNYRPVVVRAGLGFVSGQVPFRNGALLYPGRVGLELTPEEAKEATKVAALNVLAQIKNALTTWDALGGLLRMEGFVASAEGFTSQPEILDTAAVGEVDLVINVERGDRVHTGAVFFAGTGVEHFPDGIEINLHGTWAS